MNFVTDLPISECYDAILMMIDWLTKMRYFISTHTTAIAETVTDLYVNHIYHLYEFSDTIVFNQEPQFTALFWKLLCWRLSIFWLLLTAFHSEINEQTEINNASMKAYLCTYTTYQQDDWLKWLDLAEFAANNTVSETIQCSPFYVNYEYNSHMKFKSH